jgi:hypothetical protein
MASRKEMPMALQLVGQNIDTFIGNARVNGEFPDDLATQLEELKRRSEVAEEDLPTPWQFAGEVVFIKPHGAGRQWRWILHSPSIHVDVGLGRLTHIVAKARLSSAFLWEHEIGTALTLLYGFLAEFLHVPFMLQVSEVHMCADTVDLILALATERAKIQSVLAFPGHRLSPSLRSHFALVVVTSPSCDRPPLPVGTVRAESPTSAAPYERGYHVSVPSHVA